MRWLKSKVEGEYGMMGKIEEIREALLAAQKTGDHLKEYDLAQAGLRLIPGDEYFQYCAVLALSRCNAKQRALDSFYSCKLHHSNNEYVRALEPRILKDLAFLEIDAAGEQPFAGLDCNRFRTAAVTYQKAYNHSGGHYSAINAATLYLFAGDPESARALAKVAIDIARRDEGTPFFPLATLAEAHLLLGRLVEVRGFIRDAAGHRDKNLLTRARVHYQLKLVCRFLEIDPEIVAPLLPETVIHYYGHIFDRYRPLDTQDEGVLVERINAVVSGNHCAIAYGSLAPGSDILFAESVLRQGGELNVWLPFAAEVFCDISVRPAGEQWVERFQRCLAQANTVSFATMADFLGEDMLFKYCANIAMGMAVMRASSLHAGVMQLVIWDQVISDQQSSTSSMIRQWQALGHRSEVIESPVRLPQAVVRSFGRQNQALQREPHAILFSDLRGFSKLNDRGIVWYFNELHPVLARIIDAFRPHVQYVDTWGDAIFLVASKASVVARIAVALNDAIANIDQSLLGLEQPLMLRIGLHYGPVYKLYDHLAQSVTYAGTDVTKTARIEPVTPPGEIFGTESFVAMLALEGEGWARFEYAGTIPSAKNFGSFRMFHVSPRDRQAALLCSIAAPDFPVQK